MLFFTTFKWTQHLAFLINFSFGFSQAFCLIQTIFFCFISFYTPLIHHTKQSFCRHQSLPVYVCLFFVLYDYSSQPNLIPLNALIPHKLINLALKHLPKWELYLKFLIFIPNTWSFFSSHSSRSPYIRNTVWLNTNLHPTLSFLYFCLVFVIKHT